jgi:hypothetical protein
VGVPAGEILSTRVGPLVRPVRAPRRSSKGPRVRRAYQEVVREASADKARTGPSRRTQGQLGKSTSYDARNGGVLLPECGCLASGRERVDPLVRIGRNACGEGGVPHCDYWPRPSDRGTGMPLAARGSPTRCSSMGLVGFAVIGRCPSRGACTAADTPSVLLHRQMSAMERQRSVVERGVPRGGPTFRGAGRWEVVSDVPRSLSLAATKRA